MKDRMCKVWMAEFQVRLEFLSPQFERYTTIYFFSCDRCKNAFLHLPVVVRRSPKLRDLLVAVKVTHSNSALPSGSFRCGKNCATCPYIFHGLTNYTFFSTAKTRSINSHITCETKNLIYMIQCNRCPLQYIGETKRHLKDSFNGHRRLLDNANTKSKPATVAEHFLSSPHNISKDMQLILIEKIFSNRDSIRKAREAFLISKGRKIVPLTVLLSAKKRIRFQFIVQSHLLYFSVTLSIWIQICCNCYFLSHFFPVLRQHPFTIYMYIESIQCKLSLYLKKAGLASRNIVHH